MNCKAVYQVLKQLGWLVHQRVTMSCPRVRGWMSRTNRSNERWATVGMHIPCGQDGLAHLAAVIDWHDREVIDCEFALRSRAKETERRSKPPASNDSEPCAQLTPQFSIVTMD